MDDKTKPAMRPESGGFTLIELLVVIACIAVLAAMLLPALAKTRPRTMLDVCLANQKQFAVAWTMFSGDHGDYIVSASDGNHTSDSLFSWRINPGNLPSFPPVPPGQTAQRVYDDYGFQLGGLYPYIKNPDIIHCPADARYIQGLYPAWCSYSMVDNMNGAVAPVSGADYRVHMASQIKHPSGRMVMNEENDSRQMFVNGTTVYENEGTWEPYHPPGVPDPKGNPPLLTITDGGTPGWYDGPAAFHFNAATFSMCDGHAEARLWHGPDTIAFANSTAPDKYSSPYAGSASLVNPLDKADVYYVYSHIATPLWP